MSAHTNNANTAPWYSIFFRNGHLLLLSIVIILVSGLSALTNLPRLEDPRIDNRNVIALTPYPGASAERVEALVTDVIEDELRTLHEIKELKSTSRAGISVVNIELQAWVDNSTNEGIFSKIRDKLEDASINFPSGVGKTNLDTQRGATAFTLKVALSPTQTNGDFAITTRLAEELADRLRNVPGTEIVRNYGALDEEIKVTISAEQLSNAGLTIAQAAQLVSANDPKAPSGVVRTELNNSRIQVAQELDTLDAVRSIPLVGSESSGYLRVGDIAQVERAWREPVNDIGLVDGERVVFVAARMQTTVRVDKWMANAKIVTQGFAEEFAGSVKTEIIFDQNLYTEARLSDLSQNLILGSVVVMLVVLLFMGTRAAWIVGLSLPMSAAFALFSLSFYGQQIHQMSIFGIIVAIGLLIDNAIVITDEIRANLLLPNTSRLQALEKSLKHLFVPLLASTLTTILGFMPIFLLPGNIGDFVGPIAISVVMALIGSLFISLTVIAALAARYLPLEAPIDNKWHRGGVQMPLITTLFRGHLENAIRSPWKVLWLPIALPIMGFVLSGQLGNVFFPSADRDQFQIYLWLPTGTSIEKTYDKALVVNDFIEAYDGVKQVEWLVGGSIPSVYYNQVMTRDGSPHFAQAVVTTDTVEHASSMIAKLQLEVNEALPEAKIVVRAFGQGPPISSPVGVEVFGPDLNVLQELGEKVRLAMSKVPGITQSISSITTGDAEYVLKADNNVTQLSDLRYTDIAQQLQAALEGQVGGSILEGTEEIPIRLKVANADKQNPDVLASLPILTSSLSQNQQWLPLAALGEFELKPKLGGITRTNGVRVNRVEAFLLPNATAIDASNYLSELINSPDFELPKGYTIKMKGDADEQQNALGQLATYAPVLLVLMITTLILSFNSFKLAGVIGTVAILSVGLGMFSLWISGLPVGFNPILGSAGLIGVAINGSIVVIAAINANPKAKLGDVEAVVEATMSCSRHILSTTVTTVGGFVPLLLFSEGSFWPPLAVVLAGGVGFSVILSLLFTPVVVAKLGQRKARKLAKQNNTLEIAGSAV
ncbi:MAG: MMPL family transporter [Alteromonadaceae bacterium]|nr:MMPL family transporter [Alteromonadaceae bacterium]